MTLAEYEAKAERVRDVTSLVVQELMSAYAKHPGRQASLHEGFAVLLEEVDELWDEVKKKQSLRSKEKLCEEAIQIAAMAVRFVADANLDLPV